ncbi:hypothetical protein FQZ97_237470 [compost metagenome]
MYRVSVAPSRASTPASCIDSASGSQLAGHPAPPSRARSGPGKYASLDPANQFAAGLLDCAAPSRSCQSRRVDRFPPSLSACLPMRARRQSAVSSAGTAPSPRLSPDLCHPPQQGRRQRAPCRSWQTARIALGSLDQPPSLRFSQKSSTKCSKLSEAPNSRTYFR